MKREILFRGLRTDGKGWVYGNLLNEQAIGEVGENMSHYKYATVMPESVGQFTGLTDKNGTKIFESDKVKGTFPGHPQFNNVIYTVIFKDGSFQISFGPICIELNALEQIEVIGNIHEK